MAKKKVQWYEQLNDQQYFENGSFNAQKKNKNDRFVVDENNLVINSKGNKGTDVLSFGNLKLSSIEEIKEKLSFEQGYTIDITGKKIYNKDLIITVKDENTETPQTVTIKNYFKKANGKATGSTVKFIELLSDLDGSFGAGMSATKTITTEDGEEKAVAYASLVDLGLIDYREAFVLNKKGSVTGSAFNDTIVGSISNDTIKGGAGNDVIYANLGNDKLYGGAGEDTFIFDTYTKENPILGTEYYGSGSDTINDVTFQDTLKFTTSNIEDIAFTQKKRNLIITYYDKDDTEKVTKENTVTIKNYYDKKGNVVKAFKIAALNAEGEIETYTDLNKIMSEAFKEKVAEARAEFIAEAERKAQEDAEKLTKYNKIKEDLDKALADISDKNREIDSLNTIISNLNTEINGLNITIQTLTNNNTLLQSEIERLTGLLETANGNVNSLTEQLSQAQADLATANSTIDEKQSEIERLTGLLETANGNVNSLNAQLSQAQADLATANSTIAQNQEEITALKSQKTELENTVAGLNETVTNLNKTITSLETQIAELEAENDEYKSQLEDIVSYVQGTSGNDNITGTSAKEVFDVFFGEDTLTSAGADDKLRINDFYENMTFDRTDDNNDLIISYSNNNSVLLKDWFNDSTDKIDTIIDITGNEYKITSKIDDINTMSQENDTITLNIGENADFKGFDFTQNGDDMVITYYYTLNEAPETELSKEYTVTGYYAEENTVEKVVVNNSDGTLNSKWNLSDFANGYVSEGTDEAETVYNKNLTTLTGGLGDDILYSITNGNVFEFNTTSTTKGSGNDIIYNATNADKIVIKGSYVDNITCSKNGNDLLVQYCGSTITIKDYYTTDADKRIDLVEITDATNTQYPKYSLKAELSGVNITGTSENEDLFSGKNTDVIYAGVGSHKIYAHQGNDTIYSNNEGNTFEYRLLKTGKVSNTDQYTGDGDDIIYNATNKDKIKINGGSGTNFTYTKDNNDLIITYKAGSTGTSSSNNTIRIKNYYTTSADKRIDRIETGGRYPTYSILGEQQAITVTGTSANEDLIGGQYDDTIYAGVGSHKICAHQGNDIIYSNNEGNVIEIRPVSLWEATKGDGDDKIYNATNKDKIVIVSGTNNLEFKKSNNDLIISYNYKSSTGSTSYISQKDDNGNSCDANTITIKDYYTTDEDKRIDRVELTNPSGYYGYTLYSIKAELQAVTLTGTSENEDLVGGTRADTIYAGEGSHLIYAHGGNDVLYSNNEGNSFEFRFQGADYSGSLTTSGGTSRVYGDGADVIYNATNKDEIVITGHSNYLNNFECTKNGFDLVITYSCLKNDVVYGINNTITVKDYYLTDDDKRVDSLKVAGKTYSIADYAPEYSPVTYETVDNSIVLTPETDMNFKGFDFNKDGDDMIMTYYFTTSDNTETEYSKNIKIEGYYADGNTIEKAVMKNSDNTTNSTWYLEHFANGYKTIDTIASETVYNRQGNTYYLTNYSHDYINTSYGDDAIYCNGKGAEIYFNHSNYANAQSAGSTLEVKGDTLWFDGLGNDIIYNATSNDYLAFSLDATKNIDFTYEQKNYDLIITYNSNHTTVIGSAEYYNMYTSLNEGTNTITLKDWYMTDSSKRLNLIKYAGNDYFSPTTYYISAHAPAFDESKVNYDELQASVASFSSTNNSTTDIDYNDSNNASVNDWLNSGFVTEVSG